MVSENSMIPSNSLLITAQNPTTSLDADVKPLMIEPGCKAEVKQEHGALNPKADEVTDVCTMENSNGRHVSFEVGPEVRKDARSHSAATPPSNGRGSTPHEDRAPSTIRETLMGDAAPMHVSPSPMSLDKIVKVEPIDVDMDTGSALTDQARPGKRCKFVMEAVFVPSLASARRAEAERKEINKKLEQLRNPIVKKPKNTPTLSLDTIRDRLESIGYDPYPIDLKKDILDVTVRRDFMSKEYGGNSQAMCPKIAPNFVERTGMKYFMYPNLLFNPHCPEVPGAPGLLFHVGCPGTSGEGEDEKRVAGGDNKDDEELEDEEEEEDDDDFESWILICRLAQGIWQYQGQYVQGPAPRLTTQEWKQQPSKVKTVWTDGISKCDWGQSIRADIALRKELGRKPTIAEKETALENGNKFSTVTPEEVWAAFDRGEVAIYLSTMKCVGYNVDFQKDLAAKMPFFVPEPSKKKKGAQKTGRKQQAKGKRAAASATKSRKRKREESSSDEGRVSDKGDIDLESEDDDFDEIVYRPRRKRSRSIEL
ncbi:hypothetical protein B0H11DRAFT_1305882 [Mycena galericulata]|nr:hypothetical protein B0H11DRAFT_1305882 [Mycena galericulata]